MKLIAGNRHFAPFFWVQFLGALNDNIFKNALVILITYRSVELWGWNKYVLVPLAGGIFILPWLLFSATAGQLGDRFQKATIIRIIKMVEIAIMVLAALGLLLEEFGLLMVTLFMMGAQSSFFRSIEIWHYSFLGEPEYLAGGQFFCHGGNLCRHFVGNHFWRDALFCGQCG